MHMPFQTISHFFIANTPTWTEWFLFGPPALSYAWACLLLAGYLKQRHGLKTGYTRKVFHFLIFTTACVVQIVWGIRMVCLFGSMASLVVLYAVARGPGHLLYEAMAREKDAPHRTWFILTPFLATLIGGLAGNILFGSAAVAGYLVTGFGDAIGEPVGTRFGRHPYRVPSFGGVRATRSVEGSIAVWLASTLALVVATIALNGWPVPGSILLWAPVVALPCALLEAVSPHGWDNAVMQIVPAMIWAWVLKAYT